MSGSVKLRIRNEQTTWVEEFRVTDCASCGIVFAVPATFDRRRRDDARSFYCPNGHTLTYAESKADRLQRELDHARRRVSWRDEELAAARQLAKTNDHRARAYKGQLTKMRKRLAAGVCPVAGCKRSWTELHDHIETCHPEVFADLGLGLGSEATRSDDPQVGGAS